MSKIIFWATEWASFFFYNRLFLNFILLSFFLPISLSSLYFSNKLIIWLEDILVTFRACLAVRAATHCFLHYSCNNKSTSQGSEFGQKSLYIRLSVGVAAADCRTRGGRLKGRSRCSDLHLFPSHFKHLPLHHPLSIQAVAVTWCVSVPSTWLWTCRYLGPGCRRMDLRLITGLLGRGSFRRRWARIYILPRARPL